MPISEILTKIAPDELNRELPITIFLADLITRMNWDPDQFKVTRSCGNLVLDIETPAAGSFGQVLQGYHYAYQVYLVMNLIRDAHLFD